MAKLNKYEIVLSKSGKEVYKGGNIEVMKKALITFESTERRALNKFWELIASTLGSGSIYLFEYKEVV